MTVRTLVTGIPLPGAGSAAMLIDKVGDRFLEPDLGVNTKFKITVISEFGPVLSFEAETPNSLHENEVVPLNP